MPPSFHSIRSLCTVRRSRAALAASTPSARTYMLEMSVAGAQACQLWGGRAIFLKDRRSCCIPTIPTTSSITSPRVTSGTLPRPHQSLDTATPAPPSNQERRRTNTRRHRPSRPSLAHVLRGSRARRPSRHSADATLRGRTPCPRRKRAVDTISKPLVTITSCLSAPRVTLSACMTGHSPSQCALRTLREPSSDSRPSRAAQVACPVDR